MLRTEWQCHKLHTRPYGWTPAITQTITGIKYWRYTLKRQQASPTNACYAVRLAHQLSFPTNTLEVTADDIKLQIKEAKSSLWQLLGDPKRRTKWLENLA